MRTAWNKGKKGLQKMSLDTRLQMSKSHIGLNTWSKGKKQSPETIAKRIAHYTGEKHWAWISDRTIVLDNDNKDTPEYKTWRLSVYKRDNYTCKINNKDCSGRIEAHHILAWRDFRELRYDINNGITLCYHHHPRKRTEELNLSPYFQKLVLQT